VVRFLSLSVDLVAISYLTGREPLGMSFRMYRRHPGPYPIRVSGNHAELLHLPRTRRRSALDAVDLPAPLLAVGRHRQPPGQSVAR